MKRLSVAILVFCALFLVGVEAYAFRCGTKLVSEGDTKSEVLRKCGAPEWREAWEEERIERVFGVPYWTGSPYYGTRVPVAAVVHVRMEEWTYNLGTNAFMRILTFENNRLIAIETGDYGY